ncbi:uncharacterized protein PV09_07024 [Verruconis gallopava]|uniref:AB hydrolase-1 domain-containing protein n=1 Tax=Verruconis gallopava TaxID=253628 RepID=A0A0D1XH61_9PEZI|nr:uncharacterized protein PV09_07024 [Verruconis gallopava]KIW01546.1 hypothetical protein PV09_07024 [Verruconis gallopava]
MVPLQPIFKKAYLSLVGFGAVYAAFLLALTNKTAQRHALYAHKVHTDYWKTLDRPESVGFAKHQVTPFYLNTTDGEELYAWHILPIGLYAQHEEAIASQEPWPPTSFKTSLAYELLKIDPEARVVINFHGNAGHVANGYRPQTYKSLTSASSKIHIFTIDYRGFGRSTGVPSEMGLITDGVALVNYVLSLGIPPERIVLLGQSLGTQVASAVALHFADPTASAALLPSAETDINFTDDSTLLSKDREPVAFSGVVLAASFPSLVKLLKVYRFAGLIPVLSPLRVYPYIQSVLLRFIHESWNTGDRLAALVSSAIKNEHHLNLQILHAANDFDVNWRMGQDNFESCVAAMKAAADVSVEATGEWGETIKKVARWHDKVKVEWQLLMSGGHNRIVADVPVALAVMRAFGL